MAKYRKKPVVVEAVRIGWDTWGEICKFAGIGKLEDGKPTGCYVDKDGTPLPQERTSERMGVLIPTREGLMVGCEGDMLIKGVLGELYPCKSDVFAANYEAVGG